MSLRCDGSPVTSQCVLRGLEGGEVEVLHGERKKKGVMGARKEPTNISRLAYTRIVHTQKKSKKRSVIFFPFLICSVSAFLTCILYSQGVI